MLEELLESVVRWATTRPDIGGILLAGSHARGDAREDSDVDLIVLTDDPGAYTSDTGWTETFGSIEHTTTESWGAVTSVRVHYAAGLEVEFGVAPTEWASVDPVDPGSQRVLEEGSRILFDPRACLKRLQAKVEEVSKGSSGP